MHMGEYGHIDKTYPPRMHAGRHTAMAHSTAPAPAFPGPAAVAAVRGPPRGFWRALPFSRRSDNESR